jgi:hypothetical protein
MFEPFQSFTDHPLDALQPCRHDGTDKRYFYNFYAIKTRVDSPLQPAYPDDTLIPQTHTL